MPEGGPGAPCGRLIRFHSPFVSLEGGNVMNTMEIGKKYVALCNEGNHEEILTSLFSKDIVSVEAGAPPGQERTVRGLDAIRAKGKWWADNHTVHKAEHAGP